MYRSRYQQCEKGAPFRGAAKWFIIMKTLFQFGTPPNTFFSVFSIFNKILQPFEKKECFIILFCSLIVALFDVVGIAAVLPFMAMISDPSFISTNGYYNFLYKSLGFEDTQVFMIFVGLGVLCIIFSGSILKIVNNYLLFQFIQGVEKRLCTDLLLRVLKQTYQWHLNHSKSDLSQVILAEINQGVSAGLVPCMQICINLITLVAITSLLVAFDPLIAFFCFGLVFVLYCSVHYSSKGKLEGWAAMRLSANKGRYKEVSESLSLIKQVKIQALEENVIKAFGLHAARYADSQARASYIALVPRYILELIAFGGVVAFGLFAVINGSERVELFTTLGVYVFAGLRLLPAFQQIYASSARLRSGHAALNKVDELVNSFKPEAGETVYRQPSTNSTLPRIEFRNVDFKFDNTECLVLRDVSFDINVSSEWILIVGPSGCGKTTLVDILSGLLSPVSGTVRFNGELLNRLDPLVLSKKISYVPQKIYLFEGTISDNILVGRSSDTAIDQERLERCIKAVGLDELFTESSHCLESQVGPEGCWLSGGQKQRVGLARGLYNTESVLILDESLNALSARVGTQILTKIKELFPDLCVIFITHQENFSSLFSILLKPDRRGKWQCTRISDPMTLEDKR